MEYVRPPGSAQGWQVHRSIGASDTSHLTVLLASSPAQHSFFTTWIWSTRFYLSLNKTPALEHLLLLSPPAQLLLLLLSPSPPLLPPANLHLLLLTPPLPERHSSSLISSSPAPPPRNFLPPHLTPHPLLLSFTVSLPMQVKIFSKIFSLHNFFRWSSWFCPTVTAATHFISYRFFITHGLSTNWGQCPDLCRPHRLSSQASVFSSHLNSTCWISQRLVLSLLSASGIITLFHFSLFIR